MFLKVTDLSSVFHSVPLILGSCYVENLVMYVENLVIVC